MQNTTGMIQALPCATKQPSNYLLTAPPLLPTSKIANKIKLRRSAPTLFKRTGLKYILKAIVTT